LSGFPAGGVMDNPEAPTWRMVDAHRSNEKAGPLYRSIKPPIKSLYPPSFPFHALLAGGPARSCLSRRPVRPAQDEPPGAREFLRGRGQTLGWRTFEPCGHSPLPGGARSKWRRVANGAGTHRGALKTAPVASTLGKLGPSRAILRFRDRRPPLLVRGDSARGLMA